MDQGREDEALLGELIADSWLLRARAAGEAVRLLSSAPQPPAPRILVALSALPADPRWEVRHALAVALLEANQGGADWTEDLLSSLASDPAPMVRRSALQAAAAQREAAERQRLSGFELTRLGESPTRGFVTDRVRALGVGRPAARELVEMAEAVGERYYRELAAETAHEVRHAVLPVVRLVSTLRQRLEGKRAAKAVEDVLLELGRRTDFLLHQVEALLTYARDGEEAAQSITLLSLASEALRVGRERASEGRDLTGVRDTVAVPAHLVIVACPSLLHSALVNVIANAFQSFDRPGEVVVRGREVPGERVAISVQDTGRGMSAVDAEACLQRFTTSRRHEGGTGLGLPIARRIVEELHQGELALESLPGRGTTVTMTLPLRWRGGAK